MSSDNNNSDFKELSQSLLDKEAEIELLQRTFTEIGSELNLDRVFEIVSERARKLINAETLLIPLLDEHCKTYTYRGGSGKNAEEIIGESLPLEFGICGWVWKNKKPWWRGVLDDLSEEERNLWEDEAANLILVPLQGREHFLGGIAGINKIGDEEFSSRDLNLLQLFASIVSIAIENAMVVKKMEETNSINDEYRQRLEILNKQLIESGKELEYLSLYDTVTTLPNRSLFHDRLSHSILLAEINGDSIALILVDLDRFKEINEALGHEMGDLLLKKIAERFKAHVMSNETLGRLGGDEFAIIIPVLGDDDPVERAKDLTGALKDPFRINGTEIAVSASIGIATYPEHANDVSALLSHADSAMYSAKSNNLGISIYNPDFHYSTPGHLTMIADLRKAIDEKQFDLYYQPKVSILTNKVVAVEALGRWDSEVHGQVPPNIFIHVLEQNGLINAYTYWAIEKALQQARHWEKTFGKLRIAINMSPQTLMSRDFISNLHRLIKDEKEGQYLSFEITENLFLSEYERLSEVLEYICFLGITLSIDDYGTGYSSLSRLRKLPVSEIKIDQSFVKEMSVNVDSEIIVRSTIDLAHNLGLLVVAEGVEKKEAMELLKGLGCDIAQGYFIGRPVPAGQLESFLKRQG